jgi:alkylhydroperoxidase family enzyme
MELRDASGVVSGQNVMRFAPSCRRGRPYNHQLQRTARTPLSSLECQGHLLRGRHATRHLTVTGAEIVTRISESEVGSDKAGKIMGHRPEIMQRWGELDASMRFNGLLSPDLKEEVRRSLAPGIGCVSCASLGDAAEEHPERRESLAVAYAQLLMDSKAIEDGTFEVLREEFTEPEIVELTCWALFMIASQGFGAVMHFEPATEAEIDQYAKWRATSATSAVA